MNFAHLNFINELHLNSIIQSFEDMFFRRSRKIIIVKIAAGLAALEKKTQIVCERKKTLVRE